MNAKIINSILKEESKRLCNSGLVLQDFGNFSIKIDDNILIKASGRPMVSIEPKDFVLVDSFGKPINSNLSTGGSFNTQPGSSGASSAITVDDNSCNVNSMTIFCDGLASVSTGDAISLLADGDTTAFIAINADF